MASAGPDRNTTKARDKEGKNCNEGDEIVDTREKIAQCLKSYLALWRDQGQLQEIRHLKKVLLQ